VIRGTERLFCGKNTGRQVLCITFVTGSFLQSAAAEFQGIQQGFTDGIMRTAGGLFTFNPGNNLLLL
jgi:hypothetical protein